MKYSFIFSVAFLSFFFFSCQKEEVGVAPNDNSLLLPIVKEDFKDAFLVSNDLLNEYLTLTNTLSNVTSVIPLEIENDTLAYFVSYDKGWDIISADTRIESILASSENSRGIVLDPTILKEQFAGILEYIQSVKVRNDKRVSRLWSYLQLKLLSKSSLCTKSPIARARVAGMWVEVSDEPVYSEEEVIIPHIISAKWHQIEPWNSLMPQTLNDKGVIVQYPVGCGPVAAGQVIHHYRKTDSKGISIPTSATYSSSGVLEEYPLFSNFSSSYWNSMALDSYAAQINKDNTSIFLSYLAQQGNLVLSLDGTGMTHSGMQNVLNLYQLDFNESDSYDYEDIYYDLINGRPVIIGSEFNRIYNDREPKVGYHYYIIDRYKENITMFTTTYQWMPDYQPTEWELQTLPQWRFDGFSPDGRDIIDVTISRTEDTYFGMNWGGDEYLDNFYLVRSYTSESEDEAGIIPSMEFIYTPMWTINTNSIDKDGLKIYRAQNISSVFYNISDNN